MTVELNELLFAATASGWAPEASERLARGIEERIISALPSRARKALGSDEAAQLARKIAWERCRELAAKPPASGVSWGYLANVVRWRLADAVRADAVRQNRHPICATVPDHADERAGLELGPLLEVIASELEREGQPIATARRLIGLAAEGPRFERAAICARLGAAGVRRSQAEALAWLLRGGARNQSALARLATGQSPRQVFADPVVRTWVRAAAGFDQSFRGSRTGDATRQPGRRSGPVELGLARSA